MLCVSTCRELVTAETVYLCKGHAWPSYKSGPEEGP
jgi:hypothetical protein